MVRYRSAANGHVATASHTVYHFHFVLTNSVTYNEEDNFYYQVILASDVKEHQSENNEQHLKNDSQTSYTNCHTCTPNRETQIYKSFNRQTYGSINVVSELDSTKIIIFRNIVNVISLVNILKMERVH